MKEFFEKNPLGVLLVMVVLGVVLLGKHISVGGISYKKRRALAKARAAKKRKRRKK